MKQTKSFPADFPSSVVTQLHPSREWTDEWQATAAATTGNGPVNRFIPNGQMRLVHLIASRRLFFALLSLLCDL